MNSDKILYDNLSAEERASLNLNDILLVDRLELSFRSKAVGALKAVLFSAVAIFVFFVNITVNGKSDVPFGHIYNYFISALGNVGLWGITIIIAVNGVLSVYGKFFAPEGSRLRRYYGGESFVYPVFYLMGGVFTLIYTMDATIPAFTGPEFIVSSATGAPPCPPSSLAWRGSFR